MNKKGFELSISVIVTIIIAIVLLGLGVLLLNKFIGGAQEIKTELDEETDQQLSLLLEAGEKAAIPFNSFDLRRGDSVVVGFGILNIEETQSFNFEVDESSAYDAENNALPFNADEWVRFDKSSVEIKSRETFKTAILLTVPDNATSGTYIFNVEVKYFPSQTQYALKKLYVNVR